MSHRKRPNFVPLAPNARYRPVTWGPLTEVQKRFCDAYHEAQVQAMAEGALLDTEALAYIAAKAITPSSEGSPKNHDPAKATAWQMMRHPKIIAYLNSVTALEFMAAKSMAARVVMDIARSGNSSSALKAALEILDRDELFRKTRDIQIAHHHHVLPEGDALDDELKALLKKTGIVDAEFKEVKDAPLPIAYIDPETNRPVAAAGVDNLSQDPGRRNYPLKHPPKFGRKEGRPPKKALIPGKERGHEQVRAALAERGEEIEW